MPGQDIVNIWDFPSQDDQREMFLLMSLRERLVYLVDSVGMILLCLLTLPNSFLRVRFPRLFAVVLKVILPLITPPVFGAENSNMSAPKRFCPCDDIFTQKRNCSSPNYLCKSPKSPSPLSSNRSILWNFYLS